MSGKTDRWIAEKCGVSDRFVNHLRAESGANGSQLTHRTGKDPSEVRDRPGPRPRPPRTTAAFGWTDSELTRRAMVEQGWAVAASRVDGDSALIEWAATNGCYCNTFTNHTWANPFGPEDGSPRQRVRLFRERVESKLAARLAELRGRVIVCSCDGAEGECHGRDVLVPMANALGPAPKDRRPAPDPAFAAAPAEARGNGGINVHDVAGIVHRGAA